MLLSHLSPDFRNLNYLAYNFPPCTLKLFILFLFKCPFLFFRFNQNLTRIFSFKNVSFFINSIYILRYINNLFYAKPFLFCFTVNSIVVSLRTYKDLHNKKFTILNTVQQGLLQRALGYEPPWIRKNCYLQGGIKLVPPTPWNVM